MIGAIAIAATLFAPATGASAAPYTSAEVGGGSAAARDAASDLRTPWVSAVAASGLVVPAPSIITAPPGSDISGVIATTAEGTTVSVERSRYSASALAPEFVELSTNPGIAGCAGNGLRLQGAAPRPSVVAGNAGCTNGNGAVYGFFGGAGESSTRGGLEITFSRPVAAFGAWFGDLETRTDGLGVPAIVRVYDAAGSLLDEWHVEPSVPDQSLCSNAAVGCGNDTTVHVGYVGDPISRMAVIVGDEDAGGNALTEGLSMIGPTAVDAVPAMEISFESLASVLLVAGQDISVNASVTNTGQVPLELPPGAPCQPTQIGPGESSSCLVAVSVTQAHIDEGFVPVALALEGTWERLVAEATASVRVPLVQDVSFSIALSATPSTVAASTTEVTLTAIVRNTGNTSAAPHSVVIDGETVACGDAISLAPGESIVCTRVMPAPTASRVVHAVVSWTDGDIVRSGDSAVRLDVAADPFQPGQPTSPTEPGTEIGPKSPTEGAETTGTLPATGLPVDRVATVLAVGLFAFVIGSAALARRTRRAA